MCGRPVVLAWIATLPLLVAPASAADVDYLRDIKPILATRCYRCHSSLEQESNLRLDSVPAIVKGGDLGAAIVPGKSGESRLIEAVLRQGDLKMPPEGEPLSAAQIELLKKWIDQGAAPPPEGAEVKIEHWSYQRPVRPAIPSVKNTAFVRNPIDAFVASKHEGLGLTPAPEAARHVLLRRVYLDLIGLPPSPDDLRAFAADPSPTAYEKVVNRLLDSPQYGERWGRHWMDVWRYSDWDGYRAEIRESRPHIWRWRDWIVESLNRDRPYDQMIVEMLAGDELRPDDPDTLRATGYLVRNWYKFNRNAWLDNSIEHTGKAFLAATFNCCRCHDHMYDPLSQQEYYQLRAFFEPHDVRTDRIPGQADTEKDGLVRVFDAKAEAPTYLFTRGNDKEPVKDQPLSPTVPKAFANVSFKLEPVTLPASVSYPGLQPFVREEALATARADLEKAKAALPAAEEKFAESVPAANQFVASSNPQPPAPSPAISDADAQLALARATLAAAEVNLQSLEARIAADRANYATPPSPNAKELSLAAGKIERQLTLLNAEKSLLQAEINFVAAQRANKAADAKTVKAVTDAETALASAKKARATAAEAVDQPNEAYTRLTPTYPATSTGRRLALARWIATPENPRTARVAINHIWLRHFGTPLVPSVFDFGLNGQPPTNQPLLDWLAAELIDSHWRMKHIHRLIVTSSTYRLASSAKVQSSDTALNLKMDPENRYYWRANVRRLEAEAVRDATLAVAGSLDLTMGGAELEQSAGLTVPRRSIYFRNSKEKKVTFLALFDSPNVVECYQRTESIAPQQALAMANSSLTLAQARVLAKKLSETPMQKNQETASGTPDDARFIELAFERVLCREPTSDERAACAEFLTEQSKRLADPKSLTAFTSGAAASIPPAADPHARARENLVHVLLNHNDFLTVR